ncbi:6439_t:CDS:2 [Diversispora eburnea]|uniref:6439_t:CDS:1 n=1 Tax=Diversispora eburnea TaxID=1213867 RepID=A0A9N9APW3_9GLOM|nr:6439_t:CDS:2 [Diversispora eburnea]
MQLQQGQRAHAATPVGNNGSPSSQQPGVATSFLYGLTKFAAYTSAYATEAYQMLHFGGKESEIPNKRSPRKSRKNYYPDDDVMQIGVDSEVSGYEDNDEFTDNEINQSSDVNEINDNIEPNKKGQRSSWFANDEDEPPPPYDISWALEQRKNSNISTDNLSDSSPEKSAQKQIHFATPTEPIQRNSSPIDILSSNLPTPTKRRQIRVRRPRRPLRRKSSSTDISSMHRAYDDQDEMLLKVNEKLADMIVQGKAALKSKVDITEVDMILAEEKDREQRIMRELGLHTPVSRRRRNTGSSSDYEYFGGNLSDSGSYSAPESSFCDYGYGSVSGYATPNGHGCTSHNKYTSIHYNTPAQYGSPGMFDSNMESSPVSYANDYTSSLPHSRYHTVPLPSNNAYGGGYSGTIPNFNGSSSSRFGGIQPKGYEGYGGHIGPNSSSDNFGGHINSNSSNFGGHGGQGGHMPSNNFGDQYGSNYGGPNVNHYFWTE